MTARKLKPPEIDTQFELLYGDDNQFKYWETRLFNEVYLKRDLHEKHTERWANDNDLGFQKFQKVLNDAVVELKGRQKELQNWSETETINNLVKYILSGLGWDDNCTGMQNPFLEETSFRFNNKTYRTDILIVDQPQEKQHVSEAEGDDRIVEARQSVMMPVEVKYWQRLEEFRQGTKEQKSRVDIKSDDLSDAYSPNEQIVNYMSILKKDWGILTDGARWRLFNYELSSEDSSRYFEFNLYSLLQSMETADTEQDRKEALEASRYFYHFFSKSAFQAGEGEPEAFVNEVLRYSKKYVGKVEDELGARFIKAMNIACNAIAKSAVSSSKPLDLETIRNVSESSLFNILFIKSLESRGVLPMVATDYRKLSMSSIIDKIERFDPKKQPSINNRELGRAFLKGNGNSFTYSPDGYDLHDRIIELNEIINSGSGDKKFGFDITGFKESVFSDQEFRIFKTCKLKNSDWVHILFQLGYAESESLNRKYQQIPYSYFTARQLGSIYESFLDFQLREAEFEMVFEKKQWIEADLNSRKYKDTELPTVKKSGLYFTPDNKERKVTGSYYTPDRLVQFVVKKTLDPLVKRKSANEILTIKVCDPAMGSGHFLVGALNFLTRHYLFALAKECKGDLEISIPQAKRLVLDKCIFGIDQNHRAVKLARMSLWLETAQAGASLDHLDDQLIRLNSLFLNNQKNFSKIESGRFKKILNEGFDAFVANPPWESIKLNEDDFFNSLSEEMTKSTKREEKEKIRAKLLSADKQLARSYNDYVKNLDELKACVEKDFKLQNVEIEDFSTAMSENNLYKLFLELIFNRVSSKGRCGIVMPSGILSDLGTTTLRKHLLENFSLEETWSFRKDAEVFKGVTQSCCLLVFENGGSTKSVRLGLDLTSLENLFEKKDSPAIVSTAVFNALSPVTMPIIGPQNDTEASILEKIGNAPKIFKVSESEANKLVPRCGSNTTYMSKLLANKKTSIAIGKGEDIQRFRFEKVSAGYVDPTKIEGKKRVDQGGRKLSIGMISGTTDPRRIRCCIMPDNVWPINSVNYFLPSEIQNEDAIYFYMAVFNSTLIDVFVRKMCQNNNINIYAIKHLPAPTYIASDKKHREIVSLAKSLEKNYSLKTEKEVDELVAKSFELSKEEYSYLGSLYFPGSSVRKKSS